jgi:hypothetical protein
MVRRDGEKGGVFKVIQEFCQTARILEKEPAHHRLKSRGLSVERSRLMASSPTGPIPPPPHEIVLSGPEMGLETLQGKGLGLGPHLGHHRVVKV